MVCVETVGELFVIALLYLALAIVNPITVDVSQIGGPSRASRWKTLNMYLLCVGPSDMQANGLHVGRVVSRQTAIINFFIFVCVECFQIVVVQIE